MAGQRSAFFFSGRLDPPELANFNIQNAFLRDRRGAVLELLGHGIAIWWPSRPRSSFPDLRDAAEAWFIAIAGAHYLRTSIALQPHLVGWVEALDVTAREAMIGIAERRFHKVKPVQEDDPVNAEMRRAIQVARRLRGSGELERAASELLAAANEPGAQALLSCYRALECVRRIYEPSFERRQQGWIAMQSDLSIRAGPSYGRLAEAAEAIRHGASRCVARRATPRTGQDAIKTNTLRRCERSSEARSRSTSPPHSSSGRGSED